MPLLVYQLAEASLSQVDEYMQGLARVDSANLREVLSLVLNNPGKRLRSALGLVSGMFYDYVPSRLVPMAAGVELLHNATLVHDDTIDQARVRRGHPTVNNLWNDHIAVLIGDYLFACGAKVVVSTGNLRVLDLYAETIRVICDGEILQDLSAYELAPDLELYYQRITSKTASLFAAATEAGAILSQAPEEAVRALRSYGLNLGMAFQVVDDILDFVASPEQLGKPAGSDLFQGTLTLPTLLFLQQGGDEGLIRRAWKQPISRERVDEAVEAIRRSPAIEASFAMARGMGARARQELVGLPEGRPKQALEELIDYVVQRSN